MAELTTADSIRQTLGKPREQALKKIYSHLNPRMLEFISRSPLVMLSSIDEDGWPTVSPRGDAPGFVKNQGKQTLLIPEYKGNKLAFTLHNLLNNPKLALLFVMPGVHEVLRVQGTGRLIKDAKTCQQLASSTQPALLVTEVLVDKAYFHCGKALMRSHAWHQSEWPEPMKVSLGTEVAENIGESEEFVRDYDEGVEGRYLTDI